MACENLSKYYPIVMKFSGYFPLYKDTSAFDFGPDWSNLLAGHGPKVGHNELDCYEVCVSETGMLRGVTATSPSITW